MQALTAAGGSLSPPLAPPSSSSSASIRDVPVAAEVTGVGAEARIPSPIVAAYASPRGQVTPPPPSLECLASFKSDQEAERQAEREVRAAVF